MHTALRTPQPARSNFASAALSARWTRNDGTPTTAVGFTRRSMSRCIAGVAGPTRATAQPVAPPEEIGHAGDETARCIATASSTVSAFVNPAPPNESSSFRRDVEVGLRQRAAGLAGGTAGGDDVHDPALRHTPESGGVLRDRFLVEPAESGHYSSTEWHRAARPGALKMFPVKRRLAGGVTKRFRPSGLLGPPRFPHGKQRFAHSSQTEMAAAVSWPRVNQTHAGKENGFGGSRMNFHRWENNVRRILAREIFRASWCSTNPRTAIPAAPARPAVCRAGTASTGRRRPASERPRRRRWSRRVPRRRLARRRRGTPQPQDVSTTPARCYPVNLPSATLIWSFNRPRK